LIGKVNVYNILAAAAAANARECSDAAITRGVEDLDRVPGRFEPVDCGQPFTVVVDYAHTDDALRNLTSLAREFVSSAGGKGRVITLFGCGGDRDRAKRPLMGDAAGRGSDFVVLTSDNPRSEDPRAIINDAMVGLQRSGTRYTVEPDRRTAIATAAREARAGDIVLIAGKGHEKVQITREGSAPFDDVQVAREVLGSAGYDCAGAATGDDPCAAPTDRFAGVWDADAARAVHDAFTATGTPYAERAFRETARQLDGHRAAWEAMRRDSCVATRVRHAQTDEVMDLRAACLDHLTLRQTTRPSVCARIGAANGALSRVSSD